MTELLLIALGFVALSGLLAMVDAAILSISRAEVEEMYAQKRIGAGALRSIHRRLPRAVVVIVIATNTVNVLGPILVGQRAIELFGSYIIGIVTAALTLGTIIFSEIIPKSMGAHYAPTISRLSAPVIVFLSWTLFPVVYPLEKLANLFRTGRRVIGSEAQIRALVSIGRRAGHIESDEGQLVHRAFLLNDKRAEDIMTSLKDIVSIRSTTTIRKAADEVFRSTHSRYPIFGASMHKVVGLALSKDILEALIDGRDRELVATIKRDALVVPAHIPCDRLLMLFRDKHVHLAVVQHKGKTVGLVTLEDVLEQLVGEIEDEHDVEG